MSELVAPPRGTRPRNRRALILAAAAQLFAERGYDQVGVGEIAAAVGIGPSALYRHFSGKQELLQEVVSGGIAPIRDLVADVDLREPTTGVRRLANAALDGRHLGALWQRESRHLEEPARTTTHSDLRIVYKVLTTRVCDARPDLNAPAAGALAAVIVSVLGSPSFHRLDIPRPAFDDLLSELVHTVLDTELPTDFPAPIPPKPFNSLRRASRREALLTEAIHMFAAYGYTAVGNEDIAAPVGVAGPSIYNHFGSKIEMLNAAFRRGTEVLFSELSVAYRFATDATDALRRLVRSYVDFSSTNPHLIGLLISEAGHLPDAEREHSRQTQHEFIDEWVHLLGYVHPDMDRTEARVRVHAFLTAANDAARSAPLRLNLGFHAAIETIGSRLLDLPPARTDSA